MSPIIGLSGIVAAAYYVLVTPREAYSGFYFDKPSLILLGVLPPCILLLSHTVADLFTGITALIQSLFRRKVSAQKEVINVLTQASAMVRAEGIGALMKIKDRVRYELLRDGLSLIVNNFTADEIRHNLTAKINSKQTKQQLASNLFENMAKVSPGVGMIGTLLGLIDMMQNLGDDPSKIGAGMALAMITTLYGLLLGTVLYGPCSEKISLEADKALEMDLMVLEGVISLKGKKSSVHFKDIMKTYGNKAANQGRKGA